MNGLLSKLFGGAASDAVAAASTAAQDQAAALYEKFKPLIWGAAFMAVTAWLFYFLPRFRVPWARVD